jgi:hypothetical protein
MSAQVDPMITARARHLPVDVTTLFGSCAHQTVIWVSPFLIISAVLLLVRMRNICLGAFTQRFFFSDF